MLAGLAACMPCMLAALLQNKAGSVPCTGSCFAGSVFAGGFCTSSFLTGSCWAGSVLAGVLCTSSFFTGSCVMVGAAARSVFICFFIMVVFVTGSFFTVIFTSFFATVVFIAGESVEVAGE